MASSFGVFITSQGSLFISVLKDESLPIFVAPYLDHTWEVLNALETLSNMWNKSYYLYEVKIYLPELPLSRPTSILCSKKNVPTPSVWDYFDVWFQVFPVLD